MFALIAAAAVLAAAPPQADMTKQVLTDVCLPFAAGEDSGADALAFLGFIGPAEGDERELQTENRHYVLRLTSDDGADSGDTRRACVLTDRQGSLDSVRGDIRRPLEEAGFRADPEAPPTRPVWTKGGITVSLRQNDGRATLMRVSYSSLDAEAQ